MGLSQDIWARGPETKDPVKFVLAARETLQSFTPDLLRRLHAELSDRIGSDGLEEQTGTNSIKAADSRWQKAGGIINSILKEGRVLLPESPLSEQIDHY